jgi:outer membrane protein assembly factor BamB
MVKLKLWAMKKMFLLVMIIILSGCSQTNDIQKLRFELDWKYEQFAEPISIGVKGFGAYIACAGINGIETAVIQEATGESLWHIEQDEKPTNAMNFPPVFAGNKLITYNSDKLKAWELKTGYNVWEFQTESTPLGPASFFMPSPSGSRIFSGTASGFLYCIDTGSGFGAWSEKNRSEGFGQVVTWNDKVIARTLGGRLEARNKATGKMIWKNEIMLLPDDTLTIDNESIYIARPGSNLLAINPANGLYKYDINSPKSPSKAHLRFAPRLHEDSLFILEGKQARIHNKKDGIKLAEFSLPFHPNSFDVYDKLCFFTTGDKLEIYDFNGNKVAEFADQSGDMLYGLTVTDKHFITWSSRTIYALMRFRTRTFSPVINIYSHTNILINKKFITI